MVTRLFVNEQSCDVGKKEVKGLTLIDKALMNCIEPIKLQATGYVPKEGEEVSDEVLLLEATGNTKTIEHIENLGVLKGILVKFGAYSVLKADDRSLGKYCNDTEIEALEEYMRNEGIKEDTDILYIRDIERLSAEYLKKGTVLEYMIDNIQRLVFLHYNVLPHYLFFMLGDETYSRAYERDKATAERLKKIGFVEDGIIYYKKL